MVGTLASIRWKQEIIVEVRKIKFKLHPQPRELIKSGRHNRISGSLEHGQENCLEKSSCSIFPNIYLVCIYLCNDGFHKVTFIWIYSVLWLRSFPRPSFLSEDLKCPCICYSCRSTTQVSLGWGLTGIGFCRARAGKPQPGTVVLKCVQTKIPLAALEMQIPGPTQTHQGRTQVSKLYMWSCCVLSKKIIIWD